MCLLHNNELHAEFNHMIPCGLAYRKCVDGTFYYPVNGSDDRRCKYTCENVSTCGSVVIPEDHLKVSEAAINTPFILQLASGDWCFPEYMCILLVQVPYRIYLP